MFESIGNYIVKGVITFGLLLLSSYEGNDATFRSLQIEYLDSSIGIEVFLDSAFENDFEEIFKTGKSIDIWFNASVKSQGVTLEEERFSHNVTYNPLLDSYLLKKGSTNKTVICETFDCLIENLSHVTWKFRRLRSVSDYDFSISAHLDKIYFKQEDKDFNLMLLWKNKTPRLKETIRINITN